jgi:hypothetical protein
MRTLATKQHILDGAGYTYNFDREIYVNRKVKKVFSMDFVEDHDEQELEQAVHGECGGGESGGAGWQFHFNSEPAEAVKRELELVLG